VGNINEPGLGNIVSLDIAPFFPHFYLKGFFQGKKEPSKDDFGAFFTSKPLIYNDFF
jgi:hypothetical protein